LHFRDPGLSPQEDFASVRRGSVRRRHHGVRHANTIPPTGTPQILAASSKMAVEKAHVDFGLYALLAKTPSSTCLNWPRRHRSSLHGQQFGHSISDTGAMLEAFEVVAPTGKRVSLHAGDQRIMVRRELRMRGAGASSLATSRRGPAVVAVERKPRCHPREWTGARITSCTSRPPRSSVRSAAKARGVDITGETCPHTCCSRR